MLLKTSWILMIFILSIIIARSNTYFFDKIASDELDYSLAENEESYLKDEIEMDVGPLQNKADQLTYVTTRIIDKLELLVQIYPNLGIIIEPFINILVSIIKPFTRGIIRWFVAVLQATNQIGHGNLTFIQIT